MLKSTTILITLLLFTNSICAQLRVDSVLFSIEKQIYQSSNDTIKAMLILKKTALYFDQGNFDQGDFRSRQ